jgi:hypothetical protein
VTTERALQCRACHNHLLRRPKLRRRSRCDVVANASEACDDAPAVFGAYCNLQRSGSKLTLAPKNAREHVDDGGFKDRT